MSRDATEITEATNGFDFSVVAAEASAISGSLCPDI
jgi:hypothetical protein